VRVHRDLLTCHVVMMFDLNSIFESRLFLVFLKYSNLRMFLSNLNQMFLEHLLRSIFCLPHAL